MQNVLMTYRSLTNNQHQFSLDKFTRKENDETGTKT